ncbi:EF-P beta-lysylation protein EpmB [Buchnera aphidicola (Neophyllaphis podocarpi)]|uniref:EF-P beta-lysylation protein EpmB n=1 Tax=Buchnera aphidicola TaxID=9 RepID=UPI0031B80C3A
MKIILNKLNIKNSIHKKDWLKELKNVITNYDKLIEILELNKNKKKSSYFNTKKNNFPIRVPLNFVNRMEKRNSKDPLLLQVLIQKQEKIILKNYSNDPIKENVSIKLPGLLHKYNNRVLLIIKTNCAINCRYCFRKNFPYQNNLGNKENWNKSINYIKDKHEIEEVIFSGGDPLMAKDHELKWIISKIEKIKHIKRIRIHTRLPVVIPSRITNELCEIFNKTKLKIIMVTHINHPNEINNEFKKNISILKNKTGINIFNQSVMLKGINNDIQILKKLSNKLYESEIIPYYIHILDKVTGSSHFFVSKKEAISIIKKLTEQISGFLVPKLVQEKNNRKSKILINLNMK